MTISIALDAGPLQKAVQQALTDLSERNILHRIAARDHTVWQRDPDEIDNRLGWLDCPAKIPAQLAEIRSAIDAARADGLTHALLLGMGGSSLAPEVFRLVFGVADGYLDLSVLDSTEPGAVLAKTRQLDPAKTLFIPATKSGGTVETLSFLKYFYQLTAKKVGSENAGRHFVAITDPGSGLATMAKILQFRHTFINDPDIGGRYSALSLFGLVAAGAIGIGLDTLSARVQQAAENAQPALELGAFMGAGARQGRDKLTLLTSPRLRPVGAWIEQLVAESTGKEGKGLLPVEGEGALEADAYGSDRLFVYLRLDKTLDARAQALVAAGQPLLQFDLQDVDDLAAAFYHWELATAIAGHLMAIHPFDQPDVEAAKILARQMVEAYHEQGKLPVEEPIIAEGELSAYGEEGASSIKEALLNLLAHGQRNRSYIALQAYLNPTPETQHLLEQLRHNLLLHSGLATTLGYGPRFLHSTGQLHKGDGGCGLFLQLTADASEDAAIPDEPHGDAAALSFGVLIAAQASGDAGALRKAKRPVLRIHLGADTHAGLKKIIDIIDSTRD
jgi:glucose-6-phosphate isomerase